MTFRLKATHTNIHTHTPTLLQIVFVNIQNSRDNDGDIRRKQHQQNYSPPPPSKGGGGEKKVNTTQKQKKERRLADVELAQWIVVGHRKIQPIKIMDEQATMKVTQ